MSGVNGAQNPRTNYSHQANHSDRLNAAIRASDRYKVGPDGDNLVTIHQPSNDYHLQAYLDSPHFVLVNFKDYFGDDHSGFVSKDQLETLGSFAKNFDDYPQNQADRGRELVKSGWTSTETQNSQNSNGDDSSLAMGPGAFVANLGALESSQLAQPRNEVAQSEETNNANDTGSEVLTIDQLMAMSYSDRPEKGDDSGTIKTGAYQTSPTRPEGNPSSIKREFERLPLLSVTEADQLGLPHDTVSYNGYEKFDDSYEGRRALVEEARAQGYDVSTIDGDPKKLIFVPA